MLALIVLDHVLTPGEPLYVHTQTAFGLVIVGPFPDLAAISAHIRIWDEREEDYGEIKIFDESRAYPANFRHLIWPDHDTKLFAELEKSAPAA